MKTMRKLFSVLLAFVMVMGLSVTAFAADDPTYSITINDAANGETYSAYKIFSATANEAKTAYSYTITSTDAWFSDVLLYIGGGENSATADTKGVYTGEGLTLTPSAANTSVYVVTYTENGNGAFSAPDFAEFLGKQTTGKTPAASDTASIATGATTASVTLDVSASGAGYYFVDTSLGALCSLDTVVGTQQEIYEKNSIPSIKKYVLDDDDNKIHVSNTTEDWNNYDADKNYAVLDVIDTVYYKLIVDTGSDKYSDTDGTGVDANYVIVDDLPNGIVLNGEANGNYTVAVTTNTGTNGAAETWAADGNYTVAYNTTTNKLTITLLATGKLAALAESTEITITYNAKMVADADENTTDITVNGDNINTVTLTYQKQTSTSKADVKTYELVDSSSPTDFQKVDGDKKPLQGVTFILSRKVNGADQYATFANGYLTGWTTEKAKASELVTDASGTFNVKGLDAGEYILTETKTLNGYNLLTDTITAIIAEDGNVTYKQTSSTEDAENTIQVVNNTGTELPSTGGIGTTIFYVVGTILVLGAAILLIVKKRMSGTQE